MKKIISLALSFVLSSSNATSLNLFDKIKDLRELLFIDIPTRYTSCRPAHDTFVDEQRRIKDFFNEHISKQENISPDKEFILHDLIMKIIYPAQKYAECLQKEGSKNGKPFQTALDRVVNDAGKFYFTLSMEIKNSIAQTVKCPYGIELMIRNDYKTPELFYTCPQHPPLPQKS